MKSDATYKITLLEYAIGPCLRNCMVFSGYAKMDGTTVVAYHVGVLRDKNGKIFLVDTGYNYERPFAKKEADAQQHIMYRNPVEVLKKEGINPEDVEGILLTHLHWDHSGCIDMFPNAKIYIQRKEFLSWVEALCEPAEFSVIYASVDIEDIKAMITAIGEKRVVLIDGDVEDLLPGIDVKVAEDGHSWASSLITVNTTDGKYVFAGDCAYTRENLVGVDGDGIFRPNGYNCGSTVNVLKTMKDIMMLADNDINHVILSHDAEIWDAFESVKSEEDGLRTINIG